MSYSTIEGINDKIIELKKSRELIIYKCKEDIYDLLSNEKTYQYYQNNIFLIDKDILLLESKKQNLLCDNKKSFLEILNSLGINALEELGIYILKDKGSQHSDISNEIKNDTTNVIENEEIQRRTLFLKILADLTLLSSEYIRVGEPNKLGDSTNYMFFYINILDKTIMISDFPDEATYICPGNYTTVGTSTTKKTISIAGAKKITYHYDDEKWREEEKRKEQMIDSLVPLSLGGSCSLKNPNLMKFMIQQRNIGYRRERSKLRDLLDDRRTSKDFSQDNEDFPQNKSINNYFLDSLFKSKNEYKRFIEKIRSYQGISEYLYIPNTLKLVCSLLTELNSEDRRKISDNSTLVKHIVLESKRLKRKLLIEDIDRLRLFLINEEEKKEDIQRKTILALLYDNDNKKKASITYFQRGTDDKIVRQKTFEECIRLEKLYRAFVKDWNTKHPDNLLPQSFKSLAKIFIEGDYNYKEEPYNKFTYTGTRILFLCEKYKVKGLKITHKELLEYLEKESSNLIPSISQ